MNCSLCGFTVPSGDYLYFEEFDCDIVFLCKFCKDEKSRRNINTNYSLKDDEKSMLP